MATAASSTEFTLARPLEAIAVKSSVTSLAALATRRSNGRLSDGHSQYFALTSRGA